MALPILRQFQRTTNVKILRELVNHSAGAIFVFHIEHGVANRFPSEVNQIPIKGVSSRSQS